MIITVVLKGVGWMLKQSAEGYFHRPIGGDRMWHPGLPADAPQDQIERLFMKEKNRQTFATQRSNTAYLQQLGKP